MLDSAETLLDACNLIASGDLDSAAATIRQRYPFNPMPNAGRRYSPYESLCVFLRDGFIDRYSGARLVNPAVLRLLSSLLPDEFPAHPNWKQSESHAAYWELFPTIDHVVPVARGGLDVIDNWVCTCMYRNSAKSNALLDELGWKLHPAGNSEEWDGLTKWVVGYAANSNDLVSLTGEALRHKNYIQRWVRASTRAMNAV